MTLKQWINKAVTRAASNAGYEILPQWKFDRQPLVRHLQKLFLLHKIDCVFDVGGNLGQYRDLLRQDVGFKGWILSFEPVTKYISILQERAKHDAHWRIFDYALGSTEQTSTIHVTKSPGLNSFLSPRTDIVDGFWQDNSITHDETVKIHRLDTIYPGLKTQLQFESVYLKIDTQGYDLEVIKGASEVMRDIRSMQTEASLLPLYEGMPTHDAVRTCLANHGFDISGMYSVSIDDQMRLIEYDCILINSKYRQKYN